MSFFGCLAGSEVDNLGPRLVSIYVGSRRSLRLGPGLWSLGLILESDKERTDSSDMQQEPLDNGLTVPCDVGQRCSERSGEGDIRWQRKRDGRWKGRGR